MLGDDLVESCSHRLRLGDICVVCGDARDVSRAWVLALELGDKSRRLLLTLILWEMVVS